MEEGELGKEPTFLVQLGSTLSYLDLKNREHGCLFIFSS